MNEKTWREKYQANIFEKIISPLFGVNGVVCISNYLFEWAKKEALQNNLKTTAIKIPILIDVQESQINTLLNMHREDFFLFAGAPEYAKSILFIINAMKEVWVKYPNVKLKITGFDINDDRAFWLKKFLDNEDKLNKKIIVTGYLDRSELLNNYLQANALLMPLFDDLASKARFPTKLGEYLASGRPVIACKIGELKIYLTHKINALLVDPITIEEFSRQMVYVKERPEEAIQIGLKGRLIAEQFFDYPMYSNVLSKFFKSIR
jgi:glycosyltransferase involved in cell wall biosynthesis